MSSGLTRSLAAVVAAGSLLGIAACADPDGTTTPVTTLATLTSEEVQTVPPTAPPTTLGPGMVSGTDTTYEIKSGDYLSGIASRYKVKLDELVAYNEWADGANHSLHPGDTIKIPPGYTVPDETGATSTTVAGGSGDTTAEGGDSTTSPPSTVDTTQGGTYTVVANDYLGGIAKKVGSTVDAIVEANGWADGADHALHPGDVIKIP